jgi:hypothetical protein
MLAASSCDNDDDVHERIRAENQQLCRAAIWLPRALAIGDTEWALTYLVRIWHSSWKLPGAFRRVAAPAGVPRESQDFMLGIWQSHGDHLRQELGDLLLTKALRAVLPPYTGPDMTLYRGDGARNRRRRTYGLAWGASREVAERFARGIWQTTDGGSVVVRAQVSASAIICAVHEHGDARYGEDEYLVDRRQLGRVTLLARFAQRHPRESATPPRS